MERERKNGIILVSPAITSSWDNKFSALPARQGRSDMERYWNIGTIGTCGALNGKRKREHLEIWPVGRGPTREKVLQNLARKLSHAQMVLTSIEPMSFFPCSIFERGFLSGFASFFLQDCKTTAQR